MTFKQILDDAADRLNNSQPEARARFRRYLNEWYRRILADVNLMRGATQTDLAIIAGTAEYSLPSTVARVRQIVSPTNDLVLEECSLADARDNDPEADDQGIPTRYAYITDRKILLVPVPSANETLHIDHDAAVTELDDDADVPIIPEDFHYLLITGIRLNEYERNSDDRYKLARDEMATGVSALRFFLASRARSVLNPGGSRVAGSSRLGSWFPRG